MKAEDTENDDTLLMCAVGYSLGGSESINTCRFLLKHARLTGYPNWERWRWMRKVEFGLIEWLWKSGSVYMYGEDIANLNSFCMKYSLVKLHDPIMRYSAVTFLRKTMIPDIIQQHGLESFDWLVALFDEWASTSELDSFKVGKAFIDILLDIDVDVESFFKEYFENYPARTWISPFCPNRRIVFDYAEEQGWTLGWKWVYDAQDPGFLVLSEFTIMVADAYLGVENEWPFDTVDTSLLYPDIARRGPKSENRFSRRMSAKARKELKRTGQRRVRSKMPGSWVN